MQPRCQRYRLTDPRFLLDGPGHLVPLGTVLGALVSGEVRADEADRLAAVLELRYDPALVGHHAADPRGDRGVLNVGHVRRELFLAEDEETHLEQREVQLLTALILADRLVPVAQRRLHRLEEVVVTVPKRSCPHDYC